MYALAGITWMAVFALVAIMTRKTFKGKVFVAIIRYSGEFTEEKIKLALGRLNYRMKSKSARKDLYELALEVFVSGDNLSFVEKVKAVKGVEDVTVIQYDGEYYG
jgi:hypothetical protein